MMKLLLTWLCSGATVCTVLADVIINEVLVNEPGGFTSLEWIELYNNSDSIITLADLLLINSSDTVSLPAYSLDRFEYMILCKNLYSSNGSASYESYWGNNSGSWGDSDFEQSISEPIELSFSLSNQSGLLELSRESITISTFAWTSSGTDGTSWERKYPDSNVILQSVSRSHSTPGKVNSVSLLQFDLAIDSVSLKVENGFPSFSFSITNRGLLTVSHAALSLFDSIINPPIDLINLPEIPSDSSVFILSRPLLLTESLYQDYIAVINSTPIDDRSENDSLQFTGVGAQYPPIIITEFLANPSESHSSEWVELYNRSDSTIDLTHWFIGDSIRVNQITDNPVLLLPGEYAVIVESYSEFSYEYEGIESLCIEPLSWAALNNTSDIVRLVDNFQIEADRFMYLSLFENNYTYGRDGSVPTDRWGRSSEPAGTPGVDNTLFFESNDKVIKISLSSKYISPDNDGFQDDVTIRIDAPASDDYSLKIYDRYGRIVKTFFENESLIPGIVTWDGLSDNKERLPIGLYIIFAKANQTTHTTEAIVIAR